MLPKKEKIIENVDKVKKKSDDQAKLKKNRLFVIIILSLTITLSLSFLIYRKIKYILQSGQSIIPLISLNIPNSIVTHPPITLDSQLDPILHSTPGIWTIYAQISSPTHSAFTYQRGNSFNISEIHSRVNSVTPSLTSTINPALPEGLKVSEYQDISLGLYSYLINLPDKEIFFVIINPDKSSAVKSILPRLGSILYWSLVSQF